MELFVQDSTAFVHDDRENKLADRENILAGRENILISVVLESVVSLLPAMVHICGP